MESYQPEHKYFVAMCYQSPNGGYLSYAENEASKIHIKAETEEDAWIIVAEREQVDSEIPLEDRWGIFSSTKETYLNSKTK
jgi:hypothetical protein